MEEELPDFHNTLASHGFKLTDRQPFGAGGVGRYYYSLDRDGRGNGGPITHNLTVDSLGGGKTDALYTVKQNQKPWAEGSFDMFYGHNDVQDPIKAILNHHAGVSNVLDREREDSYFGDVTPKNINGLTSHEWTPGTSFGDMTYLRKRPPLNPGLESMSSSPPVSEALDKDVQNLLSGGTDGVPQFHYWGRFPGDEGTDVYHARHPDPRSPHTFEYLTTVHHRPQSRKPFSYSIVRRQSGVNDDGSGDIGSQADVGDHQMVAKFKGPNELLAHHNAKMEEIGIRTSRRSKRMSAYLEYRSMLNRSIMEKADEDLRP